MTKILGPFGFRRSLHAAMAVEQVGPALHPLD
jgi:hypothetical protein